ncbi:MAG: FecR domain-containing protein [Candidatus Omnitrophota bacterium]
MRKFLIFILCVGFLTGAASFASASDGTVMVVSYAGDVKITPAGSARAVACKPEMILGAGDHIKTGAESYLEVAFERAKDNVVRIEEKSDVIMKLTDEERIELINGEVFAVLSKLERGEEFKIKTPTAVCGARGTGWNTKTDGKVTDVSVFDKRVFVRGIKPDGSVMEKKFWVRKGFERRIKKFEKPERMQKISKRRIEKMKEKARDLRKPTGKPKEKPGRKPKEKLKDRARKTREKPERMRSKMKRKDKDISREAFIREERATSIIDRRDDKKLDEIREEKATEPSVDSVR